MKSKDEKIDIAGLREGKSEAFETLFAEFAETSLRIAMRYTGNRDDARDIVQNTMIKVLNRINTFRDGASFSAWYFRVLSNTCRDWKRHLLRRMKSPFLQPKDNPQQEPAEENSDLELIRQLIPRMPGKMRMIFILHYQEDFSVKEISEILAISRDTVRVQLLKGRRFLRKIYEENFREEI